MCWVVIPHTIPSHTILSLYPHTELCVADVLFRVHPGTQPAVEVRVAVIGNVDSGKSTMVGVLTRSMLDDGRGLARSKVFRHGHEEETGRTSSIGQHNLCVCGWECGCVCVVCACPCSQSHVQPPRSTPSPTPLDTSTPVNPTRSHPHTIAPPHYHTPIITQLDAHGQILNDTAFRSNTCGDYVSRSSKVLTLVDLAGHERYFKTTAYGLTGYLPDYCCLIVGANAGLVGMCKEHLGVALALKVPVFFVVTKVYGCGCMFCVWYCSWSYVVLLVCVTMGLVMTMCTSGGFY